MSSNYVRLSSNSVSSGSAGNSTSGNQVIEIQKLTSIDNELGAANLSLISIDSKLQGPYTSLYLFNQINAVGAGTLTTIITHMVTTTAKKLQRISCSGDNISKYSVYINGTIVDMNRTYFGGELNTIFDYTDDSNRGRELVLGDVLEVKVIHSRPSVSDYNAKIQMLEA